MKKTTSVLTLLIAAALSSCVAHTTPASSASVTKRTTQPVIDDMRQCALAGGLYEMALSPAEDALYVAGVEGFKDVQGGAVYKLDPETLKMLGLSHTDIKNSGMAISSDGKAAYVTNSLDDGLSTSNTTDGKMGNRVLFPERNPEGFPYGTRQALPYSGLLYISAMADPAMIWAADAETLKLETCIKNTDKWVIGLRYSEVMQRTYAADGGGEIFVTDPHNQRVEKRW